MRSLGFFLCAHTAKDSFWNRKTALAVAGNSSYDPAASNRPRQTDLFYQLIYAVFVSMGDRPLGTFAHKVRRKCIYTFPRGVRAMCALTSAVSQVATCDRRCTA